MAALQFPDLNALKCAKRCRGTTICIIVEEQTGLATVRHINASQPAYFLWLGQCNSSVPVLSNSLLLAEENPLLASEGTAILMPVAASTAHT